MFDLHFTKSDAVRAAWTAVFAFLAVFGTLVTGLGQYHDFTQAKAAALALLPAAIAAALTSFKNAILEDGSTLKG